MRGAARTRGQRAALIAASLWLGAPLFVVAWVVIRENMMPGTGPHWLTGPMSIVHAIAGAMLVFLVLLKPGHPRPGLVRFALVSVAGAAVLTTVAAYTTAPKDWVVATMFLGGHIPILATLVAALTRVRTTHTFHLIARWSSVVMMVASGGCMATILVVALNPGSGWDDLGVLIACVFGYMGLGILSLATAGLTEGIAYLLRRRARRSAYTVAMRCPSCGARLSMRSGSRRCEACGERIVLRVEEPRCECGYLLFRLAGAACPECGRAVAEELRWAEGGAAR